jgi:hypothetical protein
MTGSAVLFLHVRAGKEIRLSADTAVQTTERYLGGKQKLSRAVNDNLGLDDI